MFSQQKRILRSHHGKIEMESEKASDYMRLRKPIHNRPCHNMQERRAYSPYSPCHGVKTESALLLLTAEELNPRIIKSDDARLDFSAVGFWTRGE